MSHRGWVMDAFNLRFKDINLSGLRVLDVGCGGTFLQKRLEDKGMQWFGLDKEADGNNKDIKNGLMEEMPVKDNSFDMVLACHSLEHCERPVDALKEMKRVTKDWVFVATPSPCKHQILDSDEDHLFVLNTMQMTRLFEYTGIPVDTIYLQTENIHKEQDYNVISIGRKKVEG